VSDNGGFDQLTRTARDPEKEGWAGDEYGNPTARRGAPGETAGNWMAGDNNEVND
jgi:hypothetical protein